MRYLERVGKKYNSWTIIEYVGKNKFRIKCDCGTEKIGYADAIFSGKYKSCGCKKHRQEDLVGKRFGKLDVIKRVENSKDNRPMYLCKCDCGTIKSIRGDNLRKEDGTRSCGCDSYLLKNNYKHGYCFRGKTNRLYIVWADMKTRCYNCNDRNYQWYGGRGIKICDEWKDNFITFKEWAENNGYSDNLTIDRIDYNGNYEPSNCRFVDEKTQQNNKRTNHYVTYNGETKTLKEVCDIEDINYDRFKYLIRYHNMSVEEAIENTKHREKYMFKKESK